MKTFIITLNGKEYEVGIREGTAAPVKAAEAASPGVTGAPATAPAGAQIVTAAMPGKIIAVYVKAGDVVVRGQILLILEAMKMENEILAPRDGKVVEVSVTDGQTVSTGDKMITIG